MKTAVFSTLALVLLIPSGGALAQQARVPYHVMEFALHSGSYEGTSEEVFEGFQHSVLVPHAPWLRLEFKSYELGKASFITLQSAEDDGYQRLDSRSMAEWQQGSAVFNGDTVVVGLSVAPGDSGVFFELDRILVGERFDPGQVSESQCGSADDRVASTDNRVCRLFFGGCSAWRVTNGAFLTAGHCTDFDPDGGGPALPDGARDIFGVVEFNVPASDSDGTTNPAHPDDQYPIDTTNVAWHFEGEGQGLGKDWSVFAVGRNSNSGLLPHEAYGLPFRMTREAPGAGDSIRITGFGTDSGTAKFTNQTSTGSFVDEHGGSADIDHEYQVDTTGGNSGSPIIWVTNGLTIGIHTNGGCSSTAGNHGTSFEVNALEAALRNFTGSSVRFVDVGHPLPVSESGTIYRPFNTMTEAINSVPAGGIVSVVAGNYTRADGNTFTVTKAMTIEAPVGAAVIGK